MIGSDNKITRFGEARITKTEPREVRECKMILYHQAL